MKFKKGSLACFILILSLASVGFATDYDLRYFLAKTSAKESEISIREKTELLSRIEEVLTQAQQVRKRLVQLILGGELEINYQEGKHWMSKFEDDLGSIDTAQQQIRLMRENPLPIAPAIRVYKSLRDLSSNFQTYNNLPAFSSCVGDVAPDLELWADPVFSKLYLLPLAQIRDNEKKPSQPPQQEKLTPKVKAPESPKSKK